MKTYLWLILVLCWLPLASFAQIKPAGTPKLVEVPVFESSMIHSYTQLEMGYAQSKIKNPEEKGAWQGKEVHRVQLVFTKYPLKREDWLIDYEVLLQRRLKAVYELDSSLLTNPRIAWEYVLQTDCETESEAKKLFHGVVVHTKPVSRGMREVEEITFGRTEIEDSTVIEVFERHQDWDSMLVVVDWTGSMYPYGGSILLWLRMNLERRPVEHFVFFNDGNRRPDDKKVIGRTGGIYRVNSTELDSVLNKMNEVMTKGYGGDDPENDVEAIGKATRYLKGFDQVILVADNNSSVRDISLASKLRFPVRVVLCGLGDDSPIHPDYLTLAKATNGSVHTLEEDLSDLRTIPVNRPFKLKGHTYRFMDGRFRLLD